MGGSETKVISNEPFAFLLQYPSTSNWQGVQGTMKALKGCFPNGTVSSYRCTAAGGEGVEIFAGRGKGKPRRRVYSSPELSEGNEREVIQAIKEALQI